MTGVRIILSPAAKKIYNTLTTHSKKSKIARSILTAIQMKSELIKANFQYGNPISKKLIPKEYQKEYGVCNLYRVELPNYWRMIYTARQEETGFGIVVFILDIIDHKVYDKKFGYKNM